MKHKHMKKAVSLFLVCAIVLAAFSYGSISVFAQNIEGNIPDTEAEEPAVPTGDTEDGVVRNLDIGPKM